MSSVFDGARLRRIRTRRGLTLEQVAGMAGVSIPTVCRWELGQTQPIVGTVFDLAAALGVPLADLMTVRELV